MERCQRNLSLPDNKLREPEEELALLKSMAFKLLMNK